MAPHRFSFVARTVDPCPAIPWTQALSDPRRQVSWLAGPRLITPSRFDPVAAPDDAGTVCRARRLQLQGQPWIWPGLTTFPIKPLRAPVRLFEGIGLRIWRI